MTAQNLYNKDFYGWIYHNIELIRLGQPPAGYANWSLRLLANQVVELGIVESVSYETVRKLIKKTA